MIPCLPDHIGEAECPECGNNHKEFGLLPADVLTPTRVREVAELDSIHALFPALTVHGEYQDHYQKEISAVVVVSGRLVHVAYYDPDEEAWIQVRSDSASYPQELAEEFRNAIQESASHDSEFMGKELANIDEVPDPVIAAEQA
jgi:hypothetical protein